MGAVYKMPLCDYCKKNNVEVLVAWPRHGVSRDFPSNLCIGCRHWLHDRYQYPMCKPDLPDPRG